MGPHSSRNRPVNASAIATLFSVVSFSSTLLGAEVSFRNEVMAVLSKAGCNKGVCHGNQNGKGGFKLSLRGENPNLDFLSLTRDQGGRRSNSLVPDASLLLKKPLMQLPHEGGRRFRDKSSEYELLRAWITAGMPADPPGLPQLIGLEVSPGEKVVLEPVNEVPLHVEARFSDNTRRDVTRLAVYEPNNSNVTISDDGIVNRAEFGESTVIVRYLNRQVPVRIAFVPARPEFVWNAPAPQNEIDRLVFDKLQPLRINPAKLSTDHEFVRRVYLDLTGMVPTADEARNFVKDTEPNKRSKLIDELLQRSEFADCWALKWSDLLRNEEKTLDRKGVRNFHAWIRRSIAEAKPLDLFAKELIAARGSTYTHPPANYYRTLRDPVSRAEATAQLFLGIRLQCAKCHNHPFDRWTQDDYYGWTGLFARVDYKILSNRRLDQNDKHEFDGEQIVFIAERSDAKDPRTGKPAKPRLLGDAKTTFDPHGDPLQQLADWVTSPENPRFAQMQANRIWFQLLGKGIVDPIDDFRATNPPANPALLEHLVKKLVLNRFDLRQMIRTIMNSRTYQLSAEPNETNRDDESNFSHALVQRLSAEQMLDSFSRVLGVSPAFNGYPRGTRAGEIPGVMAIRPRDKEPSMGDHFLKLFGRPARLQSCECERSVESTLNQAFELVSGPMLNDLLIAPENRLGALLNSGKPFAEIVDELYWSALSRSPSSEETAATVAHLTSATDKRRALEDIAWALLTSDEFVLRR